CLPVTRSFLDAPEPTPGNDATNETAKAVRTAANTVLRTADTIAVARRDMSWCQPSVTEVERALHWPGETCLAAAAVTEVERVVHGRGRGAPDRYAPAPKMGTRPDDAGVLQPVPSNA